MTGRRRLVVGLTAAAVAAAGVGLYALFRVPALPVPNFAGVQAAHRPSDARLLDRHGDVVHELRIDPKVRRLDWTPLHEISPALVDAVLASEDRRFSRHGGVDPLALAAAAGQRIGGGTPRGASTISMQVASLLHPGLARRGGPRSLFTKWRQMRAAWALEASWSKAEILEVYLNRVTFRGEFSGIAATAHFLLDKAPHGIAEAEAAVLAALIRSPNAEPDVLARRASALRRRLGGPPDAEAVATAVARIQTHATDGTSRLALAPHLARRLLAPAGEVRALPPALRTTLDAPLQRVAIESLRRHLLASRAGHVQDGAVLVVDNGTGDVLAYVGSSGDLSASRHMDGVQARRQAGSTLKPFLYGLALERRLLTAASILADTPLEVPQPAGLYRPKNYDDRFRGPLSVRTALAGSVNIPAVRTLGLVGMEAFVGQLNRLGFEGLREDGDFYGPSLALGGADVSLWELVGAYRSLAASGRWSPLRTTPDVPAGAPRRVYADSTVFLLGSLLADRESRSVTFGLENPLATPFWTAVKTGTSKDMRDNWCLGYSERYTVGVWVGNFSGAPMRDVSGVTGAAPIWLDVMTWLHRAEPSRPPVTPDGVSAHPVRFAHDAEPARTEWFLVGTEPLQADQVPARMPMRIAAPVHGSILALDPDIPPALQRVTLEAEGAGPSARWVLNGIPLGPADRPFLWRPEAGRHSLALEDGDTADHDTVTFEVRGARPRAAAARAPEASIVQEE